MASRQQVTRRRFLAATTAATAGGMFLPRPTALAAGEVAQPSECASTDHFWYRLQPAGRYIDSQRGNLAFGYADGKLCLSEDNGHTWPHSIAFPDPHRVTFSHILKNGNILFGTGSNLYLSTDKLRTYRPITVKKADGGDYVPHTPRNPENPGWYFHTLSGVNSWDVNGAEMVAWGNYCNVLGGATPVNIYYSIDHGQTVKIAYSFGQNPYFRDDGSAGGGATGTLLGDAHNPVICRHVHTVAYHPGENAFYACTGDGDRPEGHECNWLRGTYDAHKDEWQWKVVVSASLNTRYKSGGINFVDGNLYWISDANGPPPYDRGVFRCAPVDLANPEKHTMLFNPQVESGNMIIQDGVILASHCAPASPLATGFIYSPDLGKTWAQYDLKEFGRRSPTRFHEQNGEGWFRVDLRLGWIQHAEVLFIKPKPLASNGSYAPSPIVKNLTIEPDRQSLGNGDNWPITWADDEAQYTVYCDGKGFGGSGESSMSLARITGSPPKLQAENVATGSGQKTGGGKGGRKASGLLMVDSVLFMWVRNLTSDGTGASLAWSKDRARNWTWADWNFPEIGYPVWLNAGKNYEAARDEYAYLYWPDTPSAYKTSDHILLARVPKDRITSKEAYRFFAGMDDQGQPQWTLEFKDRKPVFTDHGHCYRPDVVYNPGIKRYLLSTATSGSKEWCGTDVKYLGIFDAPTPWGPWSTVTQIEGWGGEENRFQPRIPSKWISEDGRAFYLLYSCFPKGPYQFNLQRCAVQLGTTFDKAQGHATPQP
ncbi:MAG: hypothetical protein ACYC35_14830 [Pirellulales bacterium]